MLDKLIFVSKQPVLTEISDTYQVAFSHVGASIATAHVRHADHYETQARIHVYVDQQGRTRTHGHVPEGLEDVGEE